ncbi:nickel insertion protein [Garciella nitratireducens]|uniref:TIGR00299 family protein n=1 Tax=Garciella nitratireducens DSM 15102 TaxID=1121911 RepID=A0A1T4LX39_9FIRM|nr:Protein of unknown function DUF111 [Garciella nitratireducens DSM 15102]
MDDIPRDSNKDSIWLLESNIDDTTGEALGFTMEKLLKQGAKDVFFTPIFMKKNRPAYQLSILCKEDQVNNMESIIFQNTTTIGIRKVKMNRTILETQKRRINTIYGPVQVKICKFKDREYIYPEYEEIKRICNETGLDFQRIYNEIKKQ